MTVAQFIRATMTMRCTVERNSASVDDRYAVASWTTFLTDQPCFLWAESGVEAVEGGGTAVVEQLRLMVPKETGINAGDRVNGVTQKDGADVLSGVLNIASILPVHDHDELVLTRVSGMGGV